jgi:hypothetical protein
MEVPHGDLVLRQEEPGSTSWCLLGCNAGEAIAVRLGLSMSPVAIELSEGILGLFWVPVVGDG